jgi:hypothetical protein
MDASKTLFVTFTMAVAWAITDGAASAADPTTADCLAASDASLKLGNEHKLRAERAQLLVCAAQSCPADIRKECLARVDEVNAQIPTIVFSAKEPTGADLSAVKLSIDGEVLAERLEGTALAVDPGEHTFTFEATGQPRLSKKFVVVEGQKDRRELISLGAPTEGAAAAAAATAAPPEFWTTRRTIGVATGGVGAAGVVLGSVFGLLASSKWTSSKSECPAAGCANHAAAVTDHDSASSMATVSTVAFAAGGIALAAGAVLFFTGGKSQAEMPASIVVAPTIGAESAGVSAAGVF